MSLTVSDPDGTDPVVSARDPDLAAALLDGWRLHTAARGGALTQTGPQTWTATDAHGRAFALLTLTQEAR